MWVHVSCDPSLTDSVYDDMVEKSLEDKWYCSNCINISYECSQSSDSCSGPVTDCLKCLCLNARSILPKRLDLAAYLVSFQYDIIAVTESFLDDSIDPSLVVPPSYVGYRLDRNRHGGGILVLVRDCLTVIRRSDLESDCELLWLELFTHIGPVLFGTFYRSPNSDVSSLNLLNSSLLSIHSRHCIVLCGDFNLPHINWSTIYPTVSSPCATLLCTLVNDNYLTQLVNFPTRENNILDLIFVNSTNIVSGVQSVDNLPGTDHEAIQFTLIVAPPKQIHCSRFLYNYKKADLALFHEVLSRIPWHCIPSGDIDESWSMWKDLFFCAADSAIPKVRWKKSKVKHWFSHDTIHLIKMKRRLYNRLIKSPSDGIKFRYKQISNLVRFKTRQDTESHVSSLSNKFFGSPKPFWRWLNSFKGNRSPIPPLLHNNDNVTVDTLKAETFNAYFSSVFTVDDGSDVPMLKETLTFNSSIIDSIRFTIEDVYDELINLKCDKACGPDLLPSRLLKLGAEFIAPSLAQLFQESLSTGKLPLDWTSANIVPVHKKGDKHLTSNYRPISLTSVIIKIMERIIHRQVVTILEQHNLINDCQFGFRHKHSTVSLLLEAVNDWANTLENRNSAHCVFLDLAKAFDSVSHPRLLIKLEALGITGDLLNWFKAFLSDRRQRVVVNGQFSSWLPVTSGVPQGSVLGPLLFLLYINDISTVVSYSKVKLFADDVTVYKEISCPNDATLLQLDLSNIAQWAQKWLLRLNPLKCDSIVISNKRSPPLPAYHLDSSVISHHPVVRYLGVLVDCKLNWNEHCRYVSAKATRSLNFLRHCLYNASSLIKSSVYKCVVRPTLEYACPVWHPYTTKNINTLESVQHRAARWASNSKWDAISHCWSKSSDDCIQELHWPTIQQRHNYYSICLVHDSLHHRNSLSFHEHYHLSGTSTKSHPLSIRPVTSTINSYRFSFFVNSPFLWNSIPYAILQLKKSAMFRSALRRYLF